jgi:signal transduction histidine kinase
MHSNVQLLDDMKTYDQNMTNEMKTELLRINSIIDSLLKLSNIDKFKNKEKNNLKDILEQIVKDYNKSIIEKNIDVKLEIDNNIEIDANKDYFYIFLSNLI